MKALFGAWGIGKIASKQSETWNKKTNLEDLEEFSIPPMSSTHPGFIESSPMLFFDKVYMDYFQFEIISKQIEFGYYFSPNNSEILKEFWNLRIIEPISYSAIAKKHIDEIIKKAESILFSNEIKKLYSDSSNLWKDFVTSRGGLSLPNRSGELKVLEYYSNSFSNMTKREVAIRCSHDIFDVATMSVIARELGTTICDWQMYRPHYEFLNKSDSLLKFIPFSSIRKSLSIDYLIPVPREINISNLMDLKESKYLETLKKNENIDIKLNNPNSKDLIQIRTELRKKMEIEFTSINRTINKKEGNTFIEKIKKATKEGTINHNGIDNRNKKLLILRAKNLIGENKLIEVIDNLTYITVNCEEFAEHRNELFMIQRRLTDNKFHDRNVLKREEELRVEYNKISFSLISICDDMVKRLK